MSAALSEKTCSACRGGVPSLDPDEAGKLLAEVPEWQLNDNATLLSREFRFDNFRQAMTFAGQVGELAEEQGHHPVITFGWGFCRIETQTRKIHGLHENDFILAAKIDQLLN